MLRNVPKLPSLVPHVTAEPIPGLFFKSLPFKWIAHPSSATCLSVYTCPLSVRLHVLSRLWVGQCLSWDAPFLTWAIGILGYEPGTWRPGDKSYHFLLNNYRRSAFPPVSPVCAEGEQCGAEAGLWVYLGRGGTTDAQQRGQVIVDGGGGVHIHVLQHGSSHYHSQLFHILWGTGGGGLRVPW